MPYDYLTIDENGLNTGIVSASYFPTNLQKLYNQQFINQEIFFGESDDDLIEFSLYDSNQNPLTFNRIVPSTTYSVVQSSYRDVNNVLKSYKFANPFTNLVISNNQALLHSQFDLKYNQVSPGLYYLLYNFVRNVAGNPTNNLVIKEISPSRTELRLSLAFDPTSNEKSRLDSVKVATFADKKFIILQIIDNILEILSNNPIPNNFVANASQFNYADICQKLGLKSTGQLQEFLVSTYNGYSKTISVNSTVNDDSVLQTSTFVGIAKQIENFAYTYNDVEFTAAEILQAIQLIVLKVSQDRVLQKTSLNNNDLQNVLSFFQKIIYTDWLEPQINSLLQSYSIKFYGYYKNALNFGDGNLVKILDHSSYQNPTDGRTNVQVKLDSPLPFEYGVKSICWISNISIAPVYFKVNLFAQQISKKVYLNGVNFNVEVNTSYPLNQTFSSHDSNTLEFANVKLKQRISDLLIDFNNYDTFINYSSAELRTKIAKNKLSQYNQLQTEKSSIANKAVNTVYSVSASYASEVALKNQQQIDLLNTFDDYESYLFFNTGSSIDDRIADAIVYDKNNYNSLVYQLPEYVRTDQDSADYVKFTAMVGHFFDNILVFIKKFPKSYPITEDDSNNYPKNYIEELLNSFNWGSDISKFEQSNTRQLYFNNKEATNTLSSSYFDYAKSILNRLTNNISAVYKSKGASTSFDLIRTMFGIPPQLLQVKEYGGTDILTNRNSYYVLDDIVYMTRFDKDNCIKFNITSSDFNYVQNKYYATGSIPTFLSKSIEYVSVFQGISTVELSFKFNSKNYYNNDRIPLCKKIRNGKTDWGLYIQKTKNDISGKVLFEMHPIEANSTSSIFSDELPLFNGDIFTTMIRRDVVPGYTFENPPISSSFEKNPYLYDLILDNSDYVIDDNSNNVVMMVLTSSITSSHYISNLKEWVPYQYSLMVNQYDGAQQNFSSKKDAILYHNMNQYFSSGSYYIGNFSSSVAFLGNIDKIKVYKEPLSDDDFAEHSYNINSIAIPQKDIVYQNLYYLWSFDTPINLHTSSAARIVNNQNEYYANNNFVAYNFKQQTKYVGSPVCGDVYVNDFPYQFDKLDIKRTINVDQYGPNYKVNSKINKITETVSSNLVPYEYSTSTKDVLGDDSNLVGFYITPYNYLNTQIENFLGKDGITNIIGDPKYLNRSVYTDLVTLRNEFSKFNEKYIYPQEFYSTYKFYIDFSVFDFAQAMKPSRVNLLRGLLLEPSLLERSKFNYKDLVFQNVIQESVSFNNSAKLTGSIITTINDASTHAYVEMLGENVYNADHDTYNFSTFEIKDRVDDRQFIYSKFGKYVNLNDEGLIIRDVVNINKTDTYQLVGNSWKKINTHNIGGNDITYVNTFYTNYNDVTIIGSGSGYLSSQVTGSNALRSKYTGEFNTGYCNRHLSKFIQAGSRAKYQAISSSKYSTYYGVQTFAHPPKFKYYTYTKGKNDINTTINRQGMNNYSKPIISIPGYLTLNIQSQNFPKRGLLTGSVGDPTSLFYQIPLTASMLTSASLNTYIMNL